MMVAAGWKGNGTARSSVCRLLRQISRKVRRRSDVGRAARRLPDLAIPRERYRRRRGGWIRRCRAAAFRDCVTRPRSHSGVYGSVGGAGTVRSVLMDCHRSVGTRRSLAHLILIFQAIPEVGSEQGIRRDNPSTHVGCRPGLVMVAGSGEIGSGAISSRGPLPESTVPPPSVDPFAGFAAAGVRRIAPTVFAGKASRNRCGLRPPIYRMETRSRFSFPRSRASPELDPRPFASVPDRIATGLGLLTGFGLVTGLDCSPVGIASPGWGCSTGFGIAPPDSDCSRGWGCSRVGLSPGWGCSPGWRYRGSEDMGDCHRVWIAQPGWGCSPGVGGAQPGLDARVGNCSPGLVLLPPGLDCSRGFWMPQRGSWIASRVGIAHRLGFLLHRVFGLPHRVGVASPGLDWESEGSLPLA